MGEILNSRKGIFNGITGSSGAVSKSGIAALVGLSVVGAGIWWYARRVSDPCTTHSAEITVKDESMRPLAKSGDTLPLEKNYYACNPVKRGDWVAFSLGQNVPDMVRIAVGVPGDTYELVARDSDQRWELKINGEKFEVDWGAGKKAYFFGTTKARPVLILGSPEGQFTGKVNEGEVLLLSNVPPGFMDSGVTGKRLLVETLGKVEKPEEAP